MHGWSMPRIMANPLPMEFEREDATGSSCASKRMTVCASFTWMRILPMAPTNSQHLATQSDTGKARRWLLKRLAYSRRGSTTQGTPFSADMRLLEHFTASEDGLRGSRLSAAYRRPEDLHRGDRGRASLGLASRDSGGCLRMPEGPATRAIKNPLPRTAGVCCSVNTSVAVRN